MSATAMKIPRVRTASELYRALSVPDGRSAHARAEERLSFVLAASPGLGPDGWCDSPRMIADAIESRARPDIVLKPKLVQAFMWCRAFLALGCRSTPAGAWNSTAANRLAFEAEMAGLAINGRQIAVEQGVAIAAALSLDIEIKRHRTDTWIGTQIVWGGRR